MSELLRIALVAEGVTDYAVIHAAVAAMLNGRPFDMKLLQPEGSIAFTSAGDAGPLGGGWKGVYRWCRQAVERSGGKVSDDPLFWSYDLLLLHLDADVADETPPSDMPELADVLPCAQHCPPPQATTNALRNVMLLWLGEPAMPPKTVFCTPSKSTEAWIMAIFFPNDSAMPKKGWECYSKPENRLRQQPKNQRFSKNWQDYTTRKPQIQSDWPLIVARLAEAERFQTDFLAAV
jgi:hypothetical protein